MKLLTVIGARPQIIKAAAISRAIANGFSDQVEERILHTGQHYDANMSQVFFDELGIPQPHYNLKVGSGRHGAQTAKMISGIEEVLMTSAFDGVILYGDTNSTLAGAVAASKLHVPVYHIEAGLRSFNMTMPEEINRMVTDSLADYMFTTSDVANANLVRMGNEMNKNVWFVGNVMIDTLMANRARFRKPQVWDELGLKEKEYIVMTMHRPGNVDEESHLKAMMEQIITNVHGLPIIFPIHPRTALRLKELMSEGVNELMNERFSNLHIVEPMGYLEFNYLVERAKAVVTDSGGITEETTVMGVPCITLRDNTERPETCTVGTNELIGTDPKAIKPALDKLFAGERKKGAIPELWDGHTAARIVEILAGLGDRK